MTIIIITTIMIDISTRVTITNHSRSRKHPGLIEDWTLISLMTICRISTGNLNQCTSCQNTSQLLKFRRPYMRHPSIQLLSTRLLHIRLLLEKPRFWKYPNSKLQCPKQTYLILWKLSQKSNQKLSIKSNINSHLDQPHPSEKRLIIYLMKPNQSQMKSQRSHLWFKKRDL